MTHTRPSRELREIIDSFTRLELLRRDRRHDDRPGSGPRWIMPEIVREMLAGQLVICGEDAMVR